MAELAPADDCISEESSFYGSAPPSPDRDLTAYLSYRDQTPTVRANANATIDKPLHNRFEGQPGHGKQLGESLSDFLSRLPPSKTYANNYLTDDTGPDGDGSWIWIDNPHGGPFLGYGDEGAFTREGSAELMSFLNLKNDIRLELDKQGKNTSANLGRRLSKPREEMEQRLKKLARQYEVKSGKWMFFCLPNRVDSVWQRVCEGVLDGALGQTAKVARRQPEIGGDEKTRAEQVICVYTRDFEDQQDVKRVLLGLRDLGLVRADDKRGIWYKCDAWTLVGINSGNDYGIKASTYGSVAMLNERKGK